MKSRGFVMLCRFLVVSLLFFSFQSANAVMIGTDAAATSNAAQMNRAHVASVLARADVASQLQSLGVDLKTAQERVAAMTDQEVSSLANKIDSLPAGANSSTGWWIAAIVVVALIVWWAWR